MPTRNDSLQTKLTDLLVLLEETDDPEQLGRIRGEIMHLQARIEAGSN